MRCQRLGDAALILYDLHGPAYEVARLAEAVDRVQEAVASYDTVGVFFEPGELGPDSFLRSIEHLRGGSTKCEAGRLEAHGRRRAISHPPPANKLHEIPICYELGEDLGPTAQFLDVPPETLIREHCGAVYRCYAIGFCPGFPYLGYLPDSISGVPRRSRPRVRVEPGTVGITGRQTGIYPSQVPGGWALIGKTPLELVDMDEGYFPIAAGDEVRFRRIDEADFKALKGMRL